MKKIPSSWIRDAELIGRAPSVTDEDLGYLMGQARSHWPDYWEDLAASKHPVASRQNFVELMMPVMVADQTAVPGTAEGVLWAANFAALPANFFDAPGKCLRVRATGVLTTGATPGTLTLTPRYGTTTGGTSLGAGTVSGALVASQTNTPWFLDATVICRAVGTSGSIAFFGIWESPAGYTAAPGSVECGRNAVTTIDTTSATGGMTVGATLNNAGSSLTTRKMALESLN